MRTYELVFGVMLLLPLSVVLARMWGHVNFVHVQLCYSPWWAGCGSLLMCYAGLDAQLHNLLVVSICCDELCSSARAVQMYRCCTRCSVVSPRLLWLVSESALCLLL